jgi:hypothetical protein
MKPTITDLRKFYEANGKDGHVVPHECAEGAQPWVERFLSNVNKEANETEGTIVHLIHQLEGICRFRHLTLY